MEVHEVIIVGGGCAGLFAACFLKKAGADYLLLERNPECGRKLLVTGHGRCNITNLKAPSELKQGYHEAANFVYPAIAFFAPEDCVRFLEDELGLKVKEEENNRIFPVSDKASDVRDALVRYTGKDSIRTGYRCISAVCENGIFELGSDCGEKVYGRNLILACGGSSYPHTGSDGSGFKLAEMMGHSIVPPRASLAQIKTPSPVCPELAGVTVDNVELSLYTGGTKTAGTAGSLLFTHAGISGPAAFELSREIPIKADDVYILADFAPGLTDKELLGRMEQKGKTNFVNLLAEYVPRSVAEVLTGAGDIKCADVTAQLRKSALRALKEFRFDITSAPDIDTAYCTRGGADLKELDRKSYGSKLVKGLYIIGENTDVDGISGGYNLAFAAASASLAVRSIVG